MDNLIVIFSGILLIGFVYWFFFGKREDMVFSGKTIEIVVEGGYKPSVIKIPKDQETTISFLRKDKNSCLEEIVLPDFKIKEYLPLNQKIQITITPKEIGEFSFHCGMNMFRGKVVVV
ncbi:MAG: cupredoxin domain-containing protein [bacterium]|nr:MAG: cupredoxin domain-containing protein [bacterium]